MKKKILFIVLSLILASAVFRGGIYYNQRTLGSSLCRGLLNSYAVVKEIDADNSIIFLSSQVSDNKPFEVRITDSSNSYQTIREKNDQLKIMEIEFKDLKIDDEVYFTSYPEKEGGITLHYLNIKEK